MQQLFGNGSCLLMLTGNSTLFAWYATISWFVSMLCVTVLTLIYLKSKGYYTQVTGDHFHDLGKYVFGFSVFWTYLWFSQYMLIWYGNVGEETVYFRQRFDEYPVLFYGNLIINFALPFLVLIRNDTKRKMGIMTVICSVVLIGHWIDYFLMIKPGAITYGSCIIRTRTRCYRKSGRSTRRSSARWCPSCRATQSTPVVLWPDLRFRDFLKLEHFLGLPLYSHFSFSNNWKKHP